MSDSKGKDRNSEQRLSKETAAAEPYAPHRTPSSSRSDFGQTAAAANAAAIGMGLAAQTGTASAREALRDPNLEPPRSTGTPAADAAPGAALAADGAGRTAAASDMVRRL